MSDNIINEQKFLEFYDIYVTKIYRYVFFRVGSEELAQDLTSETFLKTWQYIKDGNSIGNLSAMTYKICRNMISDHFRRNQGFPINIEEISDKNLTISDKDLTVLTEKKADISEILGNLKRIKPDYQEILIWRYVDDFEIEEIAQILGKSEGSIRTLISRALKALKGAIEVKSGGNLGGIREIRGREPRGNLGKGL